MPHTILLTGASGVLGRELATALTADGHRVVALSRKVRHDGHLEWRVGDLATGKGIAEAVTGCDIIVHAATHPFRTMAIDVDGLRRLLDAAPKAWFVYPSIVGIDRIPFFYYKHKLACERLLAARAARHTIVRLTQFHEFADRFAAMPLPVVPKGMRVQSLAARDAARVVADAIRKGQTGLLPDVGGPEVHDLAALVQERRKAAGKGETVLRMPFKGWREFAQGHNLCPDRRIGTETWSEYTARVPAPAS